MLLTTSDESEDDRRLCWPMVSLGDRRNAIGYRVHHMPCTKLLRQRLSDEGEQLKARFASRLGH